jgi:alpha-L-fucosidase
MKMISLSRYLATSVLFFALSLQAQQRITLGLLTDCQYCDCEESGPRQYRLSLAKLDSCISYFNTQKLDMVFHLGDLIDHNFSSFDSVLPRFAKSVAPVQFVLGNHDWMVKRAKRAEVPARIGLPAPYYTTTLGDWKFIILNGNDLSYFALQTRKQKDERDSMVVWLGQNFRSNPWPWNGAVGRVQMTWLESELVRAEQSLQKVIILIHFPSLPEAGHNLWNDRQMVSLLSAYPCVKAYFNGHYHPGNYVYKNGIHFVNFDGMVDTKINAYAVVTLTSDSILIDGHGRQPGYRLKIEGGNRGPGSSALLGNRVSVPGNMSPESVAEIAGRVTPSSRQLAWQQMEFTAFIHFGLNTFYNREWGEGTYDPALFNPTELDARQWVRTLHDAGMKMVIITAKHHDGFCLWPSAYTSHTVAASPWKGGHGDLVGEVAAACREQGMKFGVYLSPWDRHEPSYGDSPAYNRFFMNQLTELLTSYGEVSEVWFDGACGEGPNGKRQIYDWEAFYSLIRRLQPGAVISGMGPDVRWVGTESGYGRETEWSVLPANAGLPDSIAAASQQKPEAAGFIPRDLTAVDLGSRERIAQSRELIWYPAETDVSIRPGWFWHAAEDNLVKSPEKLLDIYFNSVGKNSVLLLNVPPDRRGLIHEKDAKSLAGLKDLLDATFRTNLLGGKGCMVSDSGFSYRLGKPVTFNVAMIREDIASGQRVERFRIDCRTESGWKTAARGTTIGSCRIIRFPEVSADGIRLVIEQTRGRPQVASFGIYQTPDAQIRQKRVSLFKVKLETQYQYRYTGGGDDAVADGLRGSADFSDGLWQGYEGDDFIATLDLGQVRPVREISAGFLQDQARWIFMPVQVEFSVSDNGTDFRKAAFAGNTTPEKYEDAIINDFSSGPLEMNARYVRVHAKNRATCPSWHTGAGSKSWIFVDEIVIE